MSTIDETAKQFVEYYNSTFERRRGDLASLYRDSSMLSWEGSPLHGAAIIMEKLISLPYQTIRHTVVTIDAQPGSSGSVHILVTGAFVVDDSAPLQYIKFFHLVPDGGTFYVSNDMFRLTYQ